MKKLLQTLSICAIVVSSMSSATAQTSEMVFDLTKKDNFDLCSKTVIQYDRDSPWKWSTMGYPMLDNYDEDGTIYYFADYLTTPELDLKTGTLYQINLEPISTSSSKKASIDILYGGEGVELEQFNTVASFSDIPGSYGNPQALSATFNVKSDGKYRISFLAYASLYLKQTTIVNLGESDIPEAVTDLTVYPDADGGNSASISFTLPTQSISTKVLTGRLTYRIYRGEDVIKSGIDASGANIVFVDETATAGKVSYSVEIANGEYTSEKATVDTYIGAETPTAATDIKVASKGSVQTLTWTAPKTGVNGALLNPDKLTYSITRILDGNATQIEQVVSGKTEFVDNIAPDGLQILSYEIVTNLNDKSSTAAASGTIKIGTVDLPFADSFANAQFSLYWDTEIVAGSINWIAKETGNYPTCDPIDNDGGLALYNSFSARAEESARLITAPISKSSSVMPVVVFYMCHTSTTKDDKVQLQVSCDNGEWVDVENATVMAKGTNGEWEKHSFNIGNAITADCESYRVSFTAISGYGYNTIIDNVRIFNLVDKDLAIVSITGPESIISGNDIEYSFTVANQGATDVSAADYSFNVDTDFQGLFELPATEDIASLEEKTFKLSIPVNAIHAMTKNYSFAVGIEYDDDDADNNLSEEMTVQALYSENAPASDLSVNGSVLSWTSAKDLDYQPVAISEDFEEFEKGSTSPFNDFVVLDLDGKAGSNCYGISGSEFKVSEKFSSYPSNADGKFLGATLSGNTQQDDWIISPAIECKDNSTMELSFRVGFKSASTSPSYKYVILYATEDYDAENPADYFNNKIKEVSVNNYSLSSAGVKADDTFYQVSYQGIPAEAKYIAIHFISKTTYDSAYFIDDITITEVDQAPLLGYNLYEVNSGLINDELIDADATSYQLPAEYVESDKDITLLLSAVYPEGEAEPAVKLIPTAIDDIAVSDASISAIDGGIGISGLEGRTAEVYDLAGRLIGAARCSGYTKIAVPGGVYIVKIGYARCKVAVR